MIFTVDIVISIHKELIVRFGGKPGVFDLGLLESSISSIYQTFDGEELYPDIIEKAARLSYSLNCNHAFNDGNKRIAMHMLALMLRYHGYIYKPTNQEVIKIGLEVASGQMTWIEFLGWVKSKI